MSDQPTQTDRATDQRCASCGALVSADAEWCGQCLQPLRRPEQDPKPAPVPVEVDGAAEADAPRAGMWPCAACDHRNPIDRDVCEVCGTPFATLMRAEATAVVHVDPGVAVRWSLVYPGLGHIKVGRAAEGVARGVLFAWTLTSSVLLLVTGGGVGGPLLPLFLLFSTATVALYAIAAVDARRLAGGDGALVSSRMLLWGAVGLVVLSAVLSVVPIVGALGR